MEGYLLEWLTGDHWKRGPEVKWTREDAEKQAGDLMRRGIRGVNVIPVTVHLEKVSRYSATRDASLG